MSVMMSAMTSPESTALPDWGEAELRAAGVGARTWRLGVSFGLVAVALLVLIPAGVPVAAVAAVIVVYVVAVVWWVRSQGRRAIASIGARAARPGELDRIENLVAGLASDLGIEAPALLVFDEGGANALVARAAGVHRIAFGATMVGEFSRTELEAVVAHCLVRVAAGQIVAAQTGLALGRLGAGLVGVTGEADDVAAAGVTRYPPALAAAVEKCEPRAGRWAPLWFVAEGPSHVPAHERAAALLDL
jgi:Zn-dependent protease with chaperone function